MRYKGPNWGSLLKTAPGWGAGIWLGRSKGRNEHMLLTVQGAIYAIAINRLPEERR